MNNYYKPLKKSKNPFKKTVECIPPAFQYLALFFLFLSFCLFVFLSVSFHVFLSFFLFFFLILLCIHSFFFFYCIYFWRGKNPEKYKISCVNFLPFYKTKKQADVNQSFSPKLRAVSMIKQKLEKQLKTENETNKNFFYYS